MPGDAGLVAGVVLAAGASTRMGRNKLLLDFDGETLLHRAARQALDAGLSPVIVVLGFEAERAAGALEGLPVRTVVNADFAAGQSGSVAMGLAAVPPDAVATVIVLADMPFVTAEMMRALVTRYAADRAGLVVSDYGGVIAPPMLYDRSLFGELMAMTGDGCGKRVYRRHRAHASMLSWPPEALGDVDVPEDLDRARARLARRSA